jgi:hypothetical protein
MSNLVMFILSPTFIALAFTSPCQLSSKAANPIAAAFTAGCKEVIAALITAIALGIRFEAVANKSKSAGTVSS